MRTSWLDRIWWPEPTIAALTHDEETGMSGAPALQRVARRHIVFGRYAGIAAFHGSVLAVTFDPRNPLETRSVGRESILTLCVSQACMVKDIITYRKQI